MTKAQSGTIAQMVYADKQPLNFARVVGDLHSILARFRGQELLFQWDCEDIAFFDLPDTRIALGWDDQPGKGYSACLTVSVGPLPQVPPLPGTEGHEEMCSRLVERLQGRFPATAILWHSSDEQLTGDLIDRLVEDLPPLMQLFPFREPDWVADAMARQSPGRAVALRGAEAAEEEQTDSSGSVHPPQHEPVAAPEPVADLAQKRDEKRAKKVAPNFSAKFAGTGVRARTKAKVKAATTLAEPAADAANDRPALPRARQGELARVREALYMVEPEVAPAKPSTQMRLAAHAMNATLIVVWAPLGAAVMTYSLLKGEDMKLSARLMVLTGLFATAIQSPMGQQMAAIAGGA
jgi:hypothetical protein